jgi:hypothetical protein
MKASGKKKTPKPSFKKKLAVARQIARRYRNVLQRLAK